MAVIFDSILGKLRQENDNASSESKIIHVVDNNEILLLEDDVGYYNRMKNLAVGDLFFWNDINRTYHYDSSTERYIELEKNGIYRIIPFDAYPKIERADIDDSSSSSGTATDIAVAGATGNWTLHVAGEWIKSAFSAELAEDGTIVIASGAELTEDGTIVLSGGGELAEDGTIVLS